MINFKDYTPKELLKLRNEITKEFFERSIIRTNNLIGDYTEWLVAKVLRLELAHNSTKDYDAEDSQGKRYQIKSTRMTKRNKSQQLSAIRGEEFDFIIAVVYDEEYEILHALKIPKTTVLKYAKNSQRTNSKKLCVTNKLIKEDSVKIITTSIKSYHL